MNVFIKALAVSFIAAFLITSAGRVFLRTLNDPFYQTKQGVQQPATPTPVETDVKTTAKSDGGPQVGDTNELASPGAQTGEAPGTK